MRAILRLVVEMPAIGFAIVNGDKSDVDKVILIFRNVVIQAVQARFHLEPPIMKHFLSRGSDTIYVAIAVAVAEEQRNVVVVIGSILACRNP